MKPALRGVVIFSLALAAGLTGEALLLLKGHCAGAERALQEDFRVLAFLRDDPDAGRLKVLEEKLRALPDVEEARFVSRDEALTQLRSQDPELVESVTWLGENPLPQAFELKLSEGSLGRFPQWLEASSAVSEWADLRYRAGQVRTILELRFYRHFLGLVLGGAFCAAAAIILAMAAGAGKLSAARHGRSGLLAFLGAAGGMTAALVAVYPMRQYFPWWSAPAAGPQLLLVCGASLLGWAFSPWLPSD